MANSEIRLGFVGAGNITELHARGLKRLPGVTIAAWSSRRMKSAGEKARRFGGEPVPLKALLARQDIDAFLVCSPTHLHKDHIIAALSAGKKVFCEKPLARNLAEAEEIIRLGKDDVYVGHVLRFFHEYSRARQMVQRGELGEIERVVCRRLNSRPEGSQSWFDNPEQSGGVLLDLLIHDFDWLLWTFGGPDAVTVQTQPGKDAQGWRHAIARLKWHNQLNAEVEGSWLHHRFEHHLYVKGGKGYLRADTNQHGILRVFKDGYAKDMSLQGLPDPYEIQMAHFMGWLRGNNPPIVTLEEAKAALFLSLRALAARP